MDLKLRLFIKKDISMALNKVLIMPKERTFLLDVAVRRTFLIPIVKIVFLQLVFIGIYVVILWKMNGAMAAPLKSGGIILFLFLQTLQSLWFLVIIIKWFYVYYQITPKEVLLHTGVIAQKRKHFALEKTESVTLEQGFLGRIFNFGTITIELFLSNSRHNLYLYDVPNPGKYMNIIEKTITSFGGEDSNGSD